MTTSVSMCKLYSEIIEEESKSEQIPDSRTAVCKSLTFALKM